MPLLQFHLASSEVTAVIFSGIGGVGTAFWCTGSQKEKSNEKAKRETQGVLFCDTISTRRYDTKKLCILSKAVYTLRRSFFNLFTVLDALAVVSRLRIPDFISNIPNELKLSLIEHLFLLLLRLRCVIFPRSDTHTSVKQSSYQQDPRSRWNQNVTVRLPSLGSALKNWNFLAQSY